MDHSVHAWHEDISFFDVPKILRKNGVSHRGLLSLFSSARHVSVTTMDVNASYFTDKEYAQKKKEVCGCKLPSSLILNNYPNSTIHHPHHADVGIIKLGKGDFIMMDKVARNNLSDIVTLAKEETQTIAAGKLGNRAGSAGGMVFSTTNSHSVRSVENGVFHRAPEGCANAVTYVNKHHQIKTFKSVYNDLFMSRYNKVRKARELIKKSHFREIVIEEMTSRLKSMSIGVEMGIIDEKAFDKLKDAIKNVKHSIFKRLGFNERQCILLDWSSTTGEMRNHQALFCHVDGNTSHSMESLILYGRVPTNHNGTADEIVGNMQDGKLVFPLHGLILNLKAVHNIIHCSLKNSPHVPDETRDSVNWTRVHG